MLQIVQGKNVGHFSTGMLQIVQGKNVGHVSTGMLQIVQGKEEYKLVSHCLMRQKVRLLVVP
jgi:hypothetical protein